jgi:mono/diheme cytochrome c family protein/glucose/arabinose dehydrogenase
MRLPALLAALVVLASPLLAQNGDRPGETQAPLPAHLRIPPTPVLSAEDSMKTFRVAPGFRVELVAAEPLVVNPVAMSFGPDGRLWVVEFRGYMPDAEGRGELEKVGVIATLRDTDGDGRMDERTEFMSGLVLARALALVDDGVLVAEPPRLWFARDTNGDGVADTKTEVASDYGITTNPEHTANGLLRGLDNWIYSANYSARFRYEGDGRFSREVTISRGQWGITQDDAGRVFYNSNSDPFRGDLVPAEYFARNPFLVAPQGSGIRIVPANLRIWPARVTPGVNRGYRILNEEGKITAMTAASGPAIYRGDLFPSDYAGNAFVPEPAGNLIKRIALTEKDGIVTGRNAIEGDEFLTSTDERFRPVNLTNGPDGALYVADMSRGLVQHRIYLTSFLRKQVEERNLAGNITNGRIYRIVPEGAAVQRTAFDLTRQTTAELVGHLSKANGWWRDTAQRLLVERRDPAAVAPLRALARTVQAPAVARLHALWTLEGMAHVDLETILAALGDPDEKVVMAAMRVAEPVLAADDNSALVGQIIAAMGPDAPARVTLQKALTLGSSPSPAALAALADFAARFGRQTYMADAIASGLIGREPEFIALIAGAAKAENAASTVTLAASALLRSGRADPITALLDQLDPKSDTPTWIRSALLAGVERFLPKTPDGKPVAAMIAVEPTALIALASSREQPEAKKAAELASLLKWQGKPGLEAETAAIAARLGPEQKIQFENGRDIYAAVCAACHQTNGEGLSGLAPQLLYSRYALGPEEALIRIVLSGKERNGLVMPPIQQTLDNEGVASVLTYLRQSWGHNADPVSAAKVAGVREAIHGREDPWTDQELAPFFRQR